MNQYKEIFEEILNVEIKDNIIMDETPEWTSFVHLRLISQIEENFGVKFEPKDILKFQSYKDGLEILEGKGIDIENEQ